MDSLLATYASSDEEEDQSQSQSSSSSSAINHKQNAPFRPSLLSSLPQPKSSSLPLSPKQTLINKTPNPTNLPKHTSLFSSIPQPTYSEPQSQPVSKPTRVLRFIPPTLITPVTNLTDFDDDDDDEYEQIQKKKRDNEYSAQPPSVTSFLSSILPAPRNSSTFGSSASARRSVIETETPNSAAAVTANVVDDYQVDVNNNNNNNNNNDDVAAAAAGYVDYATYQTYDHNVSGCGDGDVSNYHHDNYNAETTGQVYPNNWIDRSASDIAPQVSDIPMRDLGKRRRNEIPANIEIVEVRQDELMKNRPRADQAKTTGIAFGPSYQPVSTKGKPSKLHKRKHQISSLYFEMKSKETELAERRAKGFQTKAQTQGKYGW
ncbi:hypothetical protein ACFE04_028369 [Oxalis oulophora]